tara:strand:- start:11 stop:472 length:462 start_codon:yes stop_codon:yes gene_type:complete
MKVSEKQVLDYLENKIYCRVKPSGIHGVGLFAIKDIPMGTNILEEFPYKVHFSLLLKKIETFNPNVIRWIRDSYSNNGTYINIILFPHLKLGQAILYLNNSDKHNVEYRASHDYCDENDNTWNNTKVITIKDIKDGEEITLNYKHPSMFKKYD